MVNSLGERFMSSITTITCLGWLFKAFWASSNIIKYPLCRVRMTELCQLFFLGGNQLTSKSEAVSHRSHVADWALSSSAEDVFHLVLMADAAICCAALVPCSE